MTSTWAPFWAAVVAEQALADPSDRGALHVRDKVVEQIARLAALEVDDVIERGTGLGRLTGDRLPKVEATTSGGHVRASVDVATIWAAPLAQSAARVRDHVWDQLARLSGLDVDAVDVSIVAVVSPTTAAVPRRRVQ